MIKPKQQHKQTTVGGGVCTIMKKTSIPAVWTTLDVRRFVDSFKVQFLKEMTL